MNARIRVGIAVAVWLVSWSLAIAAVVLAWVFQLPQVLPEGTFLAQTPVEVQSRYDDIGTIVALIYGPMSAILIARRPHPVATILAAHALGGGLAAFSVQYGLLGYTIPDLPLQGFITNIAAWSYLPGTFMTAVVPLLITRGRLPRFDRVIVALTLALSAVATVVAFTHQIPGGPVNPFAITAPEYQAVLSPIYVAIEKIVITISGITAVIIARRWLRTSPTERNGLGWLVAGHIFLTLSYGSLIIPPGIPVPEWIWQFGMIAPVVCHVYYAAAVLVMVLDQRLWGIDVAVNRVLLWSILTVVSASAYLMLASGVAALFGWSQQASGIASAAVVALALQPLRSWLERRVDGLVYGTRATPVELVRSIGERVGELESGADGLERLVEGVRSALRLGSVSVVSARPDGPSALAGEPMGAPLWVSLRAGEHEIGWLEATARDGRRIGLGAKRSLDELSGVIAAALQLVAANDELERLRDEVLEARQEERRALRRELHDGIGPALAGIGFGLAAVDNMLTSDPDAAGDLLARLTRDLRERLTEVRGLARAMRPAAEIADLQTELAELAEDFSGAGPAVAVSAPAAERLDESQRRAVFLIAAEALHNAVRHAEASSITIDLVETARGGVRLAVSDDGIGLAPASRPGVGMSSMRERAHEAGADFDIQSVPRAGTTVTIDFGAREPVSARAPGQEARA